LVSPCRPPTHPPLLGRCLPHHYHLHAHTPQVHHDGAQWQRQRDDVHVTLAQRQRDVADVKDVVQAAASLEKNAIAVVTKLSTLAKTLRAQVGQYQRAAPEVEALPIEVKPDATVRMAAAEAQVQVVTTQLADMLIRPFRGIFHTTNSRVLLSPELILFFFGYLTLKFDFRSNIQFFFYYYFKIIYIYDVLAVKDNSRNNYTFFEFITKLGR
jgi:hypothetical protein